MCIRDRRFPEQLKRLQPDNWLHVTLSVSNPPEGGLGLYGSGMFIINPPYTLSQSLNEAMPYLAETLAQDHGARFTVEYRGN